MIYDSVYESLDCPTSDVIENDDMLDQWFENQAIKSEQSRKDRMKESSAPITSNKKIANASEIFIPVDTAADAAKVYNELNTSGSKSAFISRQKAIRSQGEIKESQMPDTKRELNMARNRAFVDKAKGV